jgi:hypothetical protein
LPDTELPSPPIDWPALDRPPQREQYRVLQPIPSIPIG